MKKKLVFFIGGLNFGGMERVIFIAEKLLKDKYDIKIVTLYQNNADYEIKNEYYNINVPPSSKRLITFIKRFFGTLKMRRELKPDIIFSFGMYLNYLSILSHYFSKNKACKIIGLRSYDWLTKPFFNKKIDKWIVCHADKVNSVSDLIAKDTEKKWNISYKKNKVIYNPYDVEEIQLKSKENIDDFIFDEKDYYIITMGRLSDQKGYNHLIRAMSVVIKKHSNIKLLILGNGNRDKDIKKMISDYGMDTNILLLGGKKNPLKYVKKSNLYVLSSLTEGFPNALSEAMCIGTPVVAVNCKSGPLELVNENKEFSYGDSDYYVCDYGILTKEMIPDYQYSVKAVNAAEYALANAICYAYCHQEKMKEIAEKAIEHMKIYDYKLFKKSIVDAIEN